jgi:hypothetical protein
LKPGHHIAKIMLFRTGRILVACLFFLLCYCFVPATQLAYKRRRQHGIPFCIAFRGTEIWDRIG